jgi:hypothetical protein
MAAETKAPFVSLNPSSYVSAGLINDVDVEVLEAEFQMWNYPENPMPADALFAMLVLKNLDDEQAPVTEARWKAGGGFKPNEDGSRPVPTGSGTFMHSGTNWDSFVNSLIANAGLPPDKLDEPAGIKILKGAKLHIVRIAEPERSGLAPRKDGRKREIYHCTKVVSWPWDKGAKKPGAARAPKAAAGATPAAEPTGDTDIGATAATLLKAILEKAGGPVKLAEAKMDVFRQTASMGLSKEGRAGLLKLLSDEAWLVGNNFMPDGEEVTLVA